MINYDLAALAQRRRKRPSGTRQRLRPISATLRTEAAYLKALRWLLRQLAVEVNQRLVPAARATRAPLVTDTDESTFQNIRALTATLDRITGETVERVLKLESIVHTDNFMDEARRSLGVDLTAVVKAEDLEAYLRAAVARNTGLIKSLSADTVKKVEQAILANEISGRSVKDLKGRSDRHVAVADRRAQLIARDQTRPS